MKYPATMLKTIRISPEGQSPRREVKQGDRVFATPANNLPVDSLIKWWIEPMWGIDAQSSGGVGVYEEDIELDRRKERAQSD